MSVDLRECLLDRIGESLDSEILDRLDSYYRLLRHWNKRINLTSLPLDPLTAGAVDRLFVEPLLAARHVSSATEWVDLGSGGGSPAIPMKIVRPTLKLTMIESRSRKASFLREAARHLDFRDVAVICERFDAIAGNPVHIGSAGLVTIRAVRLDGEVVHSCRSFLKPGGELFVFSGGQRFSKRPDGFRLRSALDLVNNAKLTIFRRS